MTEPLGAAVNETMWEIAERLGSLIPERDTREFGTVRACYGALPTPAVNRLFAFEPPSGDDLEAAVSWLADRDVPYQLTATGPVAAKLEPELAALDLEKTRESPGMALESLDSVAATDLTPPLSR